VYVVHFGQSSGKLARETRGKCMRD
jgi:hypothetical protein